MPAEDERNNETLPEPTSYAARPERLRPKAMRRATDAAEVVPMPPFEPDGRNPAYVAWLEEQSMLQDATLLGRQLAGDHAMWAAPYASPDPRAAVRQASVWFTAYPLSLITGPGESFLAALGDGGPVGDVREDRHRRRAHRAGEAGRRDQRLGAHAERRRPLRPDQHADRPRVRHRGRVPRDVRQRRTPPTARSSTTSCPGHTGKGADFRLAEMNYRDYPGIYHMVEMPEEAWHLLPDVPEGRDSVNLDAATEQRLAEAGYIIGRAAAGDLLRARGQGDQLERVTRAGRRGRRRRRAAGCTCTTSRTGSRSINWLDPTFAGCGW